MQSVVVAYNNNNMLTIPRSFLDGIERECCPQRIYHARVSTSNADATGDMPNAQPARLSHAIQNGSSPAPQPPRLVVLVFFLEARNTMPRPGSARGEGSLHRIHAKRLATPFSVFLHPLCFDILCRFLHLLVFMVLGLHFRNGNTVR